MKGGNIFDINNRLYRGKGRTLSNERFFLFVCLKSV